MAMETFKRANYWSPFSELANRCGVAIVAVTHLNKGSGAVRQSALHRFVGSIAFAAAARAAFVVVQDADNKEEPIISAGKEQSWTEMRWPDFCIEQQS